MLPVAAPFERAGEAAALASSLLWAGAGIAFRRLKGRASAGALNVGKGLVAVACFTTAVLLATGRAWPTSIPAGPMFALIASGVVGLCVCDTFLLRAMLEIGPRRATLLMTLQVALVFLGAALPPFRETRALSSPVAWAGIALAVGGIVLCTRDAPDLAWMAPHVRRRGTRDALVAAVCQSIGVLLARAAMTEGVDALEAAHVRLASGTVALLAVGVVTGRAARWRASLSRPSTAVTLAVAAFFGTFLGIGLNQASLRWATSTGVATTLNSLAPVWLIPLSSAFLGERHSRLAWLSTAIAMTGVALLSIVRP